MDIAWSLYYFLEFSKNHQIFFYTAMFFFYRVLSFILHIYEDRHMNLKIKNHTF